MLLNCEIWQNWRAKRQMKELSRALQVLMPNLHIGYTCRQWTNRDYPQKLDLSLTVPASCDGARSLRKGACLWIVTEKLFIGPAHYYQQAFWERGQVNVL